MFLFGFGFPLLAQTTNKTLPPLAPPQGELPPTFWQEHGITILISGMALLIVAGVILWQFCKAKPQPVVPPADVARTALTALQRQPEDGKVLSEISQVLRRYVSDAFEFPSGEMTTAEFSVALTSHPEIGAELAQAVAGFLHECDERKFSPATATTPFGAANRALELIATMETIRNRRETPAPTK